MTATTATSAPVKSSAPGKGTRHILSRTVIYGLLVIGAIAFLIPVYMVLVTSFKSIDQVGITSMWEFPSSFTLDNFERAFNLLSPNLVNSILLVIPATAISAILGSLNGYVLSKWRFPGANIIFPLMLFGMFIPYQAILIPMVQFLRSVGLYGGIPGLILVHVIYGLPITTLIFRNYYAEVPKNWWSPGRLTARASSASTAGSCCRSLRRASWSC